jgi:3D (Asp-Asp-Asp) domain-containing protein
VYRALVLAVTLTFSHPAFGEASKTFKEEAPMAERANERGKQKLCCGYPLARESDFSLRFYWLAMQETHDSEYVDEVDVYTKEGYFLGAFPASFVQALKMEGSGVLADGRVVNVNGQCLFGDGTCFEPLDEREFPFGRGAGKRPLVPFRSVAVDPKFVPIGEPLYIPELDGVHMPDVHVHDGCVRADDTGQAIKKRKIDFFVVSYRNFRSINDILQSQSITPRIEDPRCEYLR